MATSLPTIEGRDVELSEESLVDLRMRLRGEALIPSDPGYEQARTPFNAMQTDRPSLVVRPPGTADVVEAVNFARENGIELTVRGGGHSVAGLSSSEGGMVVDLSLMCGVDVDPEAKIARVQGGALWGDVDRETQLFGLATPGGVVSDTGVAGLTLGGGYGWLRRKYGLSSDNVVEAQVVGADGQVRTASADVNPDLFWAIRGGGGNFGIVTSFTFRLHPLGPMVAFTGVFYPQADAGKVLRGYREYFRGAPDEITPEAISITMPADPHLPEAIHDQECFIVAAVHAGEVEKGMEVMQPLRELATPLADISQPMPFTAVQSAFDGFFPRGMLQSYWKSLYLPELPDDAVELIAQKGAERPSPLIFVDTYVNGGALDRVDPGDSAFGDRAPFMVAIVGCWEDPADNAANIAWIRETWSEIGRFATGSMYLNFTGLDDEEADAGVEEAFGPKLGRLAEIKSTYDPGNFFRRNNNVSPAGA
jgi:FAD binding domain-containing protein/berberine-like enzyme